MRMTFKLAVIICIALSLGLPSPGRAQWRPDGVPIAALGNSQDCGQIIADGFDGAYIVWRDYRNTGNADIYMQRINSYGEPLWAEGGIAVAEGPSQQSSPAICLNTSGNVVVAYMDNASGNEDIYAQCVDPDGNIVWATSGMPICLNTNYQHSPLIVAGNSGSMIIGWLDQRSLTDDVYAQLIYENGTTQWTANGVVICDAENTQGNLQMIADGSGGAIFVWADYRNGVFVFIYSQKINSLGTVQWGAECVRLCSIDVWQYMPKITSDDAGGAIVVWYDKRNGIDYGIGGQRILSNGTLDWNTSGRTICGESQDQDYPDLTSDGAGGAIVAWADERTNPPYKDIYAQRLNSSGIGQWGTNGLLISDPSNSQNTPCIISDGAGGAIITWQDQRPWSDYDIYAKRVDGNGFPKWLIGEGEVCGAINNQTTPRIASDGDEGAIFTWTDLRDQAYTNHDVYAQRIDKWGYWGYPSPTLTGGADIPYDQGGRVMLTWDSSYLDAYPAESVTYYTIWRSTDGTLYAPIDSIDAFYLDTYQYAAATTADSSVLGDATHWFKIRTRIAGLDYWWESAPLSCHSVDNLSPSPPAALAGECLHEPYGLKLTWSASTDPDIAHYAVYRGTQESFVPGGDNIIASPPETSCSDAGWSSGAGYYYKVSAVDRSGNESSFALLAPEMVTGTGDSNTPTATYLGQNFPNPFNPVTTIGFGLKAPADVSLRIYDASGRLVRVLIEENRPAGIYTAQWDGRDSSGSAAASGVYFYRLETVRFVETRKMIMLR